MPPHVGTRPASCRVFLYELAFSDYPFMYGVFAKQLFLRPLLLCLTDICLFPPKHKLSSQRVLQLPPYKVSPIRTSTYTTSPLSSPLSALCVCCFVFEEEKELP
jgi:hypothetical protein